MSVVSGAGRGIGRSIARALATAGSSVVLTYCSNRSRAEAVSEEIRECGREVICHQLQVEERHSVEGLISRVLERFGRIDVWVNNAAIAQEKPFESITDEDWDRMFAVNLRGVFACCQGVLPSMREQGYGRIINLASIGGQWGGWRQVHYAAAKAGVISLTRSLARLYAEYGITVNAVSPGLVNTEMAASEIESEEGRQKVSNIPMKRIGTLQEIASVAVFLASEGAGYITGQTINVNGGMYFG